MLVSGEVTALEVEIDGTGTFTVVRGLDHSHRLFRGRSTETYLQVTASDVVKKVAARAGIQLGTVESTNVVYDHLSQGNTTDWQFLQGLAAESGCQLTVLDGKLDFRKPTRSADAPPPGGQPDTDPLILQYGTDLLRLRAIVTSAEQVTEVLVRGWDVSGRQERSLYGLAAPGGPAAGAAPVRGVVPAQVTNAADPEGTGRVKLRFPWLSDSYQSDWARTVQLGGGSNRGAMVLPEVNDEVLVAFEQGDLNRPYVVGGLYNGVDKPRKGAVDTVDSGSGAVNRRAFVSRTGHRLEFLEAAGGANGIQLVTGDDKFRLELDAKGTQVIVHSDGTILVEAKNGVTVDAGTGDIALTGKAIALTAKQGVTADAGAGTLGLTSKTQVDMHGTQVLVNGDTQTEIKGGATCAISAGLVRIN